MSRADFIRKLEDAADNIGEMSRHELQVLLRRAAIRLRNLPTGEGIDIDEEFRQLVEDMERDT